MMSQAPLSRDETLRLLSVLHTGMHTAAREIAAVQQNLADLVEEADQHGMLATCHQEGCCQQTVAMGIVLRHGFRSHNVTIRTVQPSDLANALPDDWFGVVCHDGCCADCYCPKHHPSDYPERRDCVHSK